MTVSADELMEQACAATGLDDYGPDTFLEGLRIYCDSVNESAQLDDFGTVAIPGTITNALVNRLKVVDHRRSHPEVADEAIDAPLVVIGMFRAGTTLFGNLLDADPANRCLLRWEGGDSVPPPTHEDFRQGPRVDAAAFGNEILESVTPAMKWIHHEEAAGPTECISVMSQDWKSLSWEAITYVPAYDEWLLGTDHTSAYRWHHDVLQVLQSGGVRGRWALKSPHHVLALDALTTVYPDARLVVLHRDPASLAASVCSLTSTLMSTFSTADRRPIVAAHWVDGILRESVDRLEAFRTAHPDRTIVDVQYQDFVRDPIGTMRSVYEHTSGDEHPLTDAAVVAMQRYLDDNPQGKHGRHSYDLAEFGRSAAEVREQFGDYIARYDIPLDGQE